jgi:large conductance mechanosensitive channel
MVSKKEQAIRADEDKKIERAARLKSVGNHGAGFMNFIREQGVVGLAVGLAIGTAAGASVKVIVDNLISPLVALITQGVDLSKLSWDVHVGAETVKFGWGAVVSSLITLVATAFVVYMVIHLAKLDRLDKKKED